MNKFFNITFCVLSIAFSQIALSETIEIHSCPQEIHTYTRTHTLTLHQEFLKEAIPQITSEETIVVNSAYDCDTLLIVFYEGKLKTYYMHQPLEDHQIAQEAFDDLYKCNDLPFYSDSNDPLFHTPAVKLEEIYYSNAKQCFINAEKSIEVGAGIIESPHIVLKAKEIEIMSFLIDTHNVELQCNNECSLLSSIKFILRDGTNFEFQPLLMGTVDFDYNFVAIACSYVSKVELQCLPGSFYLDENAICFN